MRVSLVVCSVLIALSSVPSAQTPAADPIAKLVGHWRLDRAGSSLPAPPDQERQGTPGQRPDGSRTGGRPPGGMGGGRGGFPGMGGGSGQPSEDDLHRLEVLRRRLSEAPEKMTISRDGLLITFDDSSGHTFTLKADGRKQDRTTGDGEFKSRARFEGQTLIVEDDFGDGAKAITSYTSMLYGDERLLEITVKVEGLPSGPPLIPGQGGPRRMPPDASKRVYELEAKP